MSLGLLDAAVLGVVEGLTEFLPVSSTGHLTITEGLLGLDVDDPSVTAFTAVIQVGAIAAVAIGLIAWSAVMVLAERRATQARGEADVTIRDGVLIGLAQCIALVPGVSRSGATISAGLLLGLDRVSATRMAFFLGIPALTAAGITQLPSALDGVDPGPVVVGTVVSFLVGYASIAWLLRLVASRSIVFFVPYRVALGVVVLTVLALT